MSAWPETMKVGPIRDWPKVFTRERRPAPFRATLSNTLGVLRREIYNLVDTRAQQESAELLVAIPAGAFRLDGRPYANAKAEQAEGSGTAVSAYGLGAVPSTQVMSMVGDPTVLGLAPLIIWRRVVQLHGFRAHLFSWAVSPVRLALMVAMLSKAKIAMTRFIAQLYTGLRGARVVRVSWASASLVRNINPASDFPASEFSASCVVSSRKCLSDSSRARRTPAAAVRRYTSRVMIPVTAAPAVPPRNPGQNAAHWSASSVPEVFSAAAMRSAFTRRTLPVVSR